MAKRGQSTGGKRMKRAGRGRPSKAAASVRAAAAPPAKRAADDASLLWAYGRGKGRKNVRLLFTCAGRRVELIAAFVHAAHSLGLKPEVHVADADPCPAASCVADRTHQVPPTESTQYIPSLLRIVRTARIDMLIPLVDHELLQLARARSKFEKLGCAAMVSSPRVVGLCRDKLAMFRFFGEHGIDTPKTWPATDLIGQRRLSFPYFLKPRGGSASKGNFVLHNRGDLDALAPRVPDAIVQEFVPGVEHTLDVYTGYDGIPRCVVPRRRIEVRGGEVTRALTVRHQGIIETGARVVRALRDCAGLITIQLIVTPAGRIRVIEVNPRFGGGVPLAIHAGADFPNWLLAEWLGRRPRIRLDHFRDGVLMLRFHQAFFLEAARK